MQVSLFRYPFYLFMFCRFLQSESDFSWSASPFYTLPASSPTTRHTADTSPRPHLLSLYLTPATQQFIARRASLTRSDADVSSGKAAPMLQGVVAAALARSHADNLSPRTLSPRARTEHRGEPGSQRRAQLNLGMPAVQE